MNATDKIYIAGHTGMVGSAIARLLRKKGFTNIIERSSKELDLRRQEDVLHFFEQEKPDFVFLAAAKVGGILANQNEKGAFFYDNIMIQTNVIHAAYQYKTTKLLSFGSSCIYPKYADQPISEDALMAGKLEPTNDAYAVSKIAAIMMCDAYRQQYGCNFISAMPTNLYGPNDNYDLETSHVLPALLRKFIEASHNGQEEVVIWGTGTPRREFLHVDDLAQAALFLMKNFNESGPVNVGTGQDISILELAHLIKRIVGYKGNIVNDLNKPDGTPLKRLDIQKIQKMGWTATIPLREGIEKVFHEIKSDFTAS